MAKNRNLTFTQRVISSNLKPKSPHQSTSTGQHRSAKTGTCCKKHPKTISPGIKQWLKDDPSCNPPKVTIDMCMEPHVNTTTYSNTDITWTEMLLK